MINKIIDLIIEHEKKYIEWLKEMPIYEYRCQKCGYAFERLESKLIKESVCPKCHNKADHIMSTFNSNFADLKIQREFGHDLMGQQTSEGHKA